jgi:arylsulfatase A-like enzyme
MRSVAKKSLSRFFQRARISGKKVNVPEGHCDNSPARSAGYGSNTRLSPVGTMERSFRATCNPFFVIVFAALFGFVSCKGKESTTVPAVSESKHSVVMISIDTLRADYLKLYSPQGIETPNMESLASNGIVFRKVISQIPYTLPSHCSLLTGLYPATHGVRDNVHDALPKSIHTLAEDFKAGGYQTAGFIGSMVLSRQTGLSRGFDYYDDFFSRADVKSEDLGAIERRAGEVVDSFEHWFDKRNTAQNYFVFLHFYDPHSPYDPPAAFRPATNDMKELYKGEIRYVDSVLGKLFLYLKQKNSWDSTIILVTSDHGEMLGEHGELGHGFFLYQPALQVPMIIRSPSITKIKNVTEMVQLIDVPPTLLALAGLPVEKSMQGESLASVIKGARKKNRLGFSESYFAALQFGVSPLYAAQQEGEKYISSPKPEFYNLTQDPGELKNVIGDEQAQAQQLKEMLSLYQNKYHVVKVEKNERTVSSEEAEQFAAIGYLGGQIPEESWDREKDPKDFIQDWNDLLNVTSLVTQGQYARALPMIQKITAKYSDKKSLPTSLALLESKCYMGMGDFKKAEAVLDQLPPGPELITAKADFYARTGNTEQATELYRQALDHQFSYFVLYNYALFLKRTGKTDEALATVKRVHQTRSDLEEGIPFLAETYFLLGDAKEAEKLLIHLIDQRPWEMKWYVELAGVMQAQGRIPEAILLLRNNYEKFSDRPDYLMRMGILYTVAGQPVQGLEAFQQMVRVGPTDPRGYYYLAKAMLDQKQDPAVAIQVAARGFQFNPDPQMQIFGHYVLAEAYRQAGKQAESEQETENAHKLEKMISGS